MTQRANDKKHTRTCRHNMAKEKCEATTRSTNVLETMQWGKCAPKSPLDEVPC